MNKLSNLNFTFGLFVSLLVLLLRTANGQLLVGNGNSIAAYNFDGTLINPTFITGVTNPQGIAVSGSNIFVGNQTAPGTIAEYNLDGTAVNTSLISGVNPAGIAINGTNIYVANAGAYATVGEYNLDGTPVNPSLITGVTAANGIAISGTNLFVANHSSGGVIGKYTLDGTVVNAALISGLLNPAGIAISGTNLYVVDFGFGKVGKYGLDGTIVNTKLISVTLPVLLNGIAINGGKLYVLYSSGVVNGSVGEYNLDGTVINSSFISGLSNGLNYGISFTPPPEIRTGDSSFGVQTNVFGFNVAGISNQTVTVESCSNLDISSWGPLQTNILGSGPYYFSDPAWTNYPARFYRVQAQ